MFHACYIRFVRRENNAPRITEKIGSFETELVVTAFNRNEYGSLILPAFRSDNAAASPVPLENTSEAWDSFTYWDGNRWWFLSCFYTNRNRQTGETETLRSSAIYNSVGFLPVAWTDGSEFVLHVECEPFDQASLDRMLRDFRDGLYEIILAGENPLTASAAVSTISRSP